MMPPQLKPLTRNSFVILEFIVEFIEGHQYSPTFREIAEATEMSVSNVHKHVRRLVDAGRLGMEDSKVHRLGVVQGQTRGLYLIDSCKNCGRPFELPVIKEDQEAAE